MTHNDTDHCSSRHRTVTNDFAGCLVDGASMFITDEEAAAMDAQACRTWYGVKAQSVVHSQIKRLMAKGDGKGVKAWQQVARALDSLKTEPETDSLDPDARLERSG